MRLDLAYTLKPGDKVYNCFTEELIVESKQIFYADNNQEIHDIQIWCLNQNNTKINYDYEDLYFSGLEDESDETKAWVEWATENKDDFYLDQDDLTLIKYAFHQGFASGFNYKRKILAEEQLQK